ncbi:alpha/beta hydrolase [Xanthomonas sp. XNM01]|nr:alpha/beta hydrolase [Xanthomonas sp. XNM01]
MAERRRSLRVLAVALGIVVLGYAAICALLYTQQRAMIYHPGLTRAAVDGTDFALERGPAVTLRGWTVDPGRHDALLYFGGNAERIEGWRGPFAAWFEGRSVYLVAHPGYGASDGTPGEQALLGDALAVYDEVRRRHPDGRIGVVGRSLGSGVAAWVAAQREVDRLALITPFDSLAAVGQAHYPWLPVRWLASERYPSSTWLQDYAGPVLVLRAGRDTVVPPGNTDRLLAVLPHAEVVDFPAAGHNDLSDDPRYAQALIGFFR